MISWHLRSLDFIIALLLLTKTISAEAGLPIITGIVAFVIGNRNIQDKDQKIDSIQKNDSEKIEQKPNDPVDNGSKKNKAI